MKVEGSTEPVLQPACPVLAQSCEGAGMKLFKFSSSKLAASLGRTMNTKHVATVYIPLDKGIMLRLPDGC